MHVSKIFFDINVSLCISRDLFKLDEVRIGEFQRYY